MNKACRSCNLWTDQARAMMNVPASDEDELACPACGRVYQTRDQAEREYDQVNPRRMVVHYKPTPPVEPVCIIRTCSCGAQDEIVCLPFQMMHIYQQWVIEHHGPGHLVVMGVKEDPPAHPRLDDGPDVDVSWWEAQLAKTKGTGS
jgi:hypothetical protein